MRTLREWIHRLWGTLLPRRHDSDLEQELRLHLELGAEAARRIRWDQLEDGTPGRAPTPSLKSPNRHKFVSLICKYESFLFTLVITRTTPE